MLAALRNRASGVVVKILLLLLVLSFGAWGVADVFSPGSGPQAPVASVGDRDISSQQVANEIQRELQRLRPLIGNIDNEQARALGIPQRVVQQLVNTALLDQGADDLGLVIDDGTVRAAIEENPAFKNQIKRFDRNVFQQVLSQNNLNEAGYVVLLRGAMAREQMLSATTVAKAPQVLAEGLHAFYKEQRTADVLTITPANVPAVGTPDDATLKAYHQDNAPRFTAPEYRKLTAVVLRASEIAPEIAVEEDELKQLYAEREAEFVKPETRTLEQILTDNEDTAKKAAALIASGTDFATAAKDVANMDADAIKLGDLARDQLLGELADPVFALDEGAVSAPLQSALGWHVVRVVKVMPEKRQTYGDVRDAIKKDVQNERAVDALYDMSNRLEDALGGGATLEEAASQMGLRVETVQSLDQTGRDRTGKPVLLALETNAFVPAAFALGEGQESVLTETEAGYFIVRVDAVTAPALKPFETVRTDVLAAWTAEQEANGMETLAQDILKKLETGEDLAALAKTVGATITTTAPFTRRGEGLKDNELPRAVIDLLFAMNAGEAATGDAGNVMVVAQLKTVTPANLAADTSDVDTLAADLAASIRADLVAQLTAGLSKKHAIDVNARAIDQLF